MKVRSSRMRFIEPVPPLMISLKNQAAVASPALDVRECVHALIRDKCDLPALLSKEKCATAQATLL